MFINLATLNNIVNNWVQSFFECGFVMIDNSEKDFFRGDVESSYSPS